MKKLVSILLACALLLSCSACGSTKTTQGSEAPDQTQSSTQNTENTQDTITVVDQADNTVTLPKDIKRIVVCDIYPLPSVLSVFFDSAKKIVGMAGPSMSAAKNSLLSQLYPEILNASTDFINGSEINMEELLKLNPDVVFYSASNPDQGQQLQANGFHAVAISVNKWQYNAIETLNNWISLLSQIFPENDKTQKVSSYSHEVYNLIQTRVGSLSQEEKARVFFLFQYDESQILTSGKLFFGQWWADAIGAINVAEELSTDNSAAVNLEQVYSWNPAIIFMTNFTTAQPRDLFQNTIGNYVWSGVDAVKNQKVYKMPLGMYRSYTPGVDTPITLLWLAKSVYPDLFGDVDVTQKVVDYYQSVFGITLTNEQAESIFAPTADAAQGF